ncbi:hypothetical protein RN001_008761 [Aquatica leii]|uniref:Farnesol dehydrogenase n=1 Tax=Aquatica leii TaxID=1421715 RepID=A0AAN7P4N9_9COLE|nr:hypothetical protein RN001_008761 [Aquatica leii]
MTFSVQDLSPVPSSASKMQGKQQIRKKQHSEIITTTPNKNLYQDMKQKKLEKMRKINLVAFDMVGFMSRWVSKVAVVTGASSGCGAATVKRLLEENVIVVGIARRTEKIKELSNSKNLYAVKADVTNEEELLEAFTWIKHNLGPIHILVNCAGVFRMTNYLNGKTEHWKEMMNVNYFGLCICTREAVKDMRANNVDGHIIQINDICGHKLIGIENMNVYCSSKFPVTAAVEGLRVELNEIKSQIKVSSICPGYIKTEIIDACIKEQPEAEQFLKQLEDEPSLSPDDIADTVIYLLSTPPHVQIHNIFIRAVGSDF